ncbi:MAG: hypothetical protein II719_00360 [Clostridia bacterium]|nr:hypothetical protein [Clostridia bacterium]
MIQKSSFAHNELQVINDESGCSGSSRLLSAKTTDSSKFQTAMPATAKACSFFTPMIETERNKSQDE